MESGLNKTSLISAGAASSPFLDTNWRNKMGRDGGDWATGHKERFPEFHMRLTITKAYDDEQNVLLE